MTTRILVYLLALAATASMAFAANPRDIKRTFEAEFKGRPFATKVPVATNAQVAVNGQGCLRLVDTEIPFGGVSPRYYMRAGCWLPNGAVTMQLTINGSYIPFSALTRLIPRGTTVYVQSIEVKDDRVELLLSTDANQLTVFNYGKLKLMYGRGYQTRSPEELLEEVSESLVIARFERKAATKEAINGLESRLSAVKSRLAALPADPSSQRLEALKEQRQIIGELVGKRREIGADSSDKSTSEDSVLQLDEAIVSMQKSVGDQQVKEAQAKLGDLRSRSDALKPKVLGKLPTTFPEWQDQIANTEAYRDFLRDQKNLIAKIESVGGAVSEAEKTLLKEQLSATDEHMSSLQQLRDKMKLAQTDAEFSEMKRTKIRLLDIYARAFGSPKERSALQGLIGHLQRMRDNRHAANEMGSTTASTQLKELELEITKYNRR